MYYNVTEKVRRVMESYFRLDTPLYFSYSHLVCRTAIEGGPSSPRSLSGVGCTLALCQTLRPWRRLGRGPSMLPGKPAQVRDMEEDPARSQEAFQERWWEVCRISVPGVHGEAGDPASQRDQFLREWKHPGS